MVGYYVRLDRIGSVPLAILSWWKENWRDPWPGPQLMLPESSLRERQLYCEHKG